MPKDNWVGRRFEVDVERVAHGGHCVARHGGRVVFVRHTLPGERVLVEVTEDRSGSFCRADAVEIISAAAGRVPAPCRYSGPGGCGGCDWQHATAPVVREMKADVISEQLQRLAGIELRVSVEQVDPAPLGWRTRMQYAAIDGLVGLHPHRSDRVIDIDTCLIAAPDADISAVRRYVRPETRAVEIEVGDAPPAISLVDRRRRRRTAAGGVQRHHVAGREYRVRPGGFWQVHSAAAEVLVQAVLQYADARPSDAVLDLFCGVGLFTAQLATRVGVTGRVVGFEGSAGAVADAQRNIADLPQCTIERAAIDAGTVARMPGEIDVVVLDPPRTGARRPLVEAICARAPRRVVYVACDPAALARDVGVFAEHGWRLEELRAFDLFPMTHHVECVALLLPPARCDEPRPPAA